MNKSSTWLLDFKSDIYSQTGEDGIIQKILETLPETDKWCVEFGAWDGQHLSNTRHLIENFDYAAVLIEGNRTRFEALQAYYANTDRIVPLNQLVGFEQKENLDHILKKTPIPIDFDFLSIDIDGNDYHVWQAIAAYKPKLICIEFNPTIPTEINFVQPANVSINQGSSLSAFVELGKMKGYELISVLPYNAFFIRSEYYPLFQIADNRPQVLRVDLSAITYLFSGYDGQIFLRGGLTRLPWHRIPLTEAKIQHLPKLLRKYPETYNSFERLLFRLYLLFYNPQLLLARLRKKIPYLK